VLPSPPLPSHRDTPIAALEAPPSHPPVQVVKRSGATAFTRSAERLGCEHSGSANQKVELLHRGRCTPLQIRRRANLQRCAP